jgi:hypothetical protein
MKHAARRFMPTPLVSHKNFARKYILERRRLSSLRRSNVEVGETCPGGGSDGSLLKAISLTRRVRSKKQAAGTTRLSPWRDGTRG